MAVLTTAAAARPGARTPGRHRRIEPDDRKPIRTDIEGLRAVAVLGVLAYHAALPFLPGGYVGVDVFFVISGFLITGLIHREIDRTGTLSVTKFWAKRVKRLLPAASFVLLVTAIASALVLAPIQRADVGRDIGSAAFYVANWRFAAEQTDYLGAELAPSPVLHYWSLCVEEQFYLVWPFLLLGLARFARRRALALRPVLIGGLATVVVLSFLWSLHETSANQPYAFFGTPARVWELALGGLLALVAPYLVRGLGASVRAVAGWVGLAMILGSYLLITGTTVFPGTAVVWPVVGAVLVILAGLPTDDGPDGGRAHSRALPGPVAVLGVPFMRSTGRYSYALYLWHWPLLVLTAAVVGHTLSPWFAVVVVALSYVPARLSWTWIEQPFRRSNALVEFPVRAAVLGTVATVTVVVAAMALVIAGQSTVVVRVATTSGVVAVNPAAAQVDNGKPFTDGCFQNRFHTVDPKPCVYGDPNSEHVVALFGDSHAVQWFPAVEPVVAANGWQLRLYAKSSCSVADTDVYIYRWKRAYTECSQWRENVIKEIERDRPEVVMTGTVHNYRAMNGDRMAGTEKSRQILVPALERTYERLEATGAQVVVLADFPAAPQSVPLCLSEGNADGCDFATAAPAARTDVRAAKRTRGVELLDVVPKVCPNDRCSAVTRNTILMTDATHLTASFAATLVPDIRRTLT